MINASKRSLLLCIALLIPFIYLLANSTDYHPPLKPTNSPFTFTETEITAHPGETVQVCVDKAAGGLVFGTTSIVVDAVGNTSPHLSGFAPVTLIFPSGVTRACFDLVVNSDEVTSEYRLVIHGTFEELIILVKERESLHGLCGVFPPHTAESDNGEVVFYDRFGNSYPQKKLQSSNHQTARQLLGNDGDSGYFDLIFDPDVLALNEEELQVVCDVFRDLSEIVQRPMSQNNCGTTELSNVHIELTTNVPENPLVLGSAAHIFYQIFGLHLHIQQWKA
ncbi:hypothetical protein [Lewinella sp. LCG006]|uniref:hypothetical protein n=1 Tax=Lewinella sp. LCG006 TaxID=3231911 RepID=UPI00346074DB